MYMQDEMAIVSDNIVELQGTINLPKKTGPIATS